VGYEPWVDLSAAQVKLLELSVGAFEDGAVIARGQVVNWPKGLAYPEMHVNFRTGFQVTFDPKGQRADSQCSIR
jgi:hypothetical protein